MKLKSFAITITMLLTLCDCSSALESPSSEAFLTLPPVILSEAPDNGTPVAEPSEHSEHTPEPVEKSKKLSLFLTGNTKIEQQPLYMMAQEYMRLNPEVEFEFLYYNYSRSFRTRDLLNAIQSGEGSGDADIIELSFLVEVEDVLSRYDLFDLDEMMSQDENFAREDYFENILDAMRADDGKLYSMPVELSPFFFAINKKFDGLLNTPFENYGTVTFRQMLDIYDQMAGERGREGLYFLDLEVGADAAVFWTYNINGIKNDEYKSFKSSYENEELLRRWLATPYLTGSVPDEPDNEIVFSLNAGLYNYDITTCFFDYRENNFTSPTAFASPENRVLFSSASSLMINEKCKDKELAWDFIKFCQNNEPLLPDDTGQQQFMFYSVARRDSFRAAYKSYFTGLYEHVATNYGVYPSKEKEAAVELAVDRLTAIMEQCGQYERKSINRGQFYNQLLRYRSQSITFEELINQIENTIREF